MFKRMIIAVHRWLGVTLCLIFLLWFPAGIGMMSGFSRTVRTA